LCKHLVHSDNDCSCGFDEVSAKARAQGDA
jgi:hypothetical protein